MPDSSIRAIAFKMYKHFNCQKRNKRSRIVTVLSIYTAVQIFDISYQIK